MGEVGMCFHPDQDRILTGFSDGYKFAGNIQHKLRQIGNAALGSKLKEAVERKL
ncbi:hypothetical protein CsSME_00005898 [Camellia sinensis var. sinensis]